MECFDRAGWTVRIEISYGMFRIHAEHNVRPYQISHTVMFDELSQTRDKIVAEMVAFEEYLNTQY